MYPTYQRPNGNIQLQTSSNTLQYSKHAIFFETEFIVSLTVVLTSITNLVHLTTNRV